jgi:hypothetical protein
LDLRLSRIVPPTLLARADDVIEYRQKSKPALMAA